MAHSLWHSIQSDRTQREMLRDAARARPDLAPEFVHNIEWAVRMGDELAVARNDAVHTPVRFAVIPGGPVLIYQRISGRRQAVTRMEIIPTADVWLDVRGDLVALTGYCETLYRHQTLHGPLAPWARRPQLAAVPRDVQRFQDQPTDRQGRKRGKHLVRNA